MRTLLAACALGALQTDVAEGAAEGSGLRRAAAALAVLLYSSEAHAELAGRPAVHGWGREPGRSRAAFSPGLFDAGLAQEPALFDDPGLFDAGLEREPALFSDPGLFADAQGLFDAGLARQGPSGAREDGEAWTPGEAAWLREEFDRFLDSAEEGGEWLEAAAADLGPSAELVDGLGPVLALRGGGPSAFVGHTAADLVTTQRYHELRRNPRYAKLFEKVEQRLVTHMATVDGVPRPVGRLGVFLLNHLSDHFPGKRRALEALLAEALQVLAAEYIDELIEASHVRGLGRAVKSLQREVQKLPTEK